MSFEQEPTPTPEVIIPPPAPLQPDRKGVAIASLVLGALSLLSFCLVFCSAPLGIASIITGIIGLKSTQRPLAIAGIVLGALGFLVSVVLALMGIALLPFLQDYQNFNFGPGQLVP